MFMKKGVSGVVEDEPNGANILKTSLHNFNHCFQYSDKLKFVIKIF